MKLSEAFEGPNSSLHKTWENAVNTEFSDFMRNASEEEKREVYEAAGKAATEEQNKVIAAATPEPQWESRIRQILSNVPDSDKARQILNLIDQLLAAQKAEMVEELQGMKYTFKKVDWGNGIFTEEPVEDETKSNHYAKGYNSALDALIEKWKV